MLRTIIVTTLLIAGGVHSRCGIERHRHSRKRGGSSGMQIEAIKSTPPYRGLENPIAAGMKRRVTGSWTHPPDCG